MTIKVYHGTTKKYWEQIKKDGKIKASLPNPQFDCKCVINVSRHLLDIAASYADKDNNDSVVLEIEIDDKKLVINKDHQDANYEGIIGDICLGDTKVKAYSGEELRELYNHQGEI